MSAEIALIAGSSVAGAISAAVIERLSRVRGEKTKPAPPSLNAARTELVSLMFEKGLASEAITRVYEASQEGKIDRLERDRLLLKYKQQLDSLNGRIAQLQPVADMADLQQMRDGLMSLLEGKISALDQKLQALGNSGAAIPANDPKVDQIIAESTKIQAAPVDQKPFKAEEKSIDQLQKEIMQALHRLEQVEIDKD